MIEYTPPGRGKFAVMPKDLIDAEMSPAARVVLMHMLKNVADWEESVERIAKNTHMGKFQVTSALKELKKHGYARQTTKRLGGNLTTKGWDFAWPAFSEEKPCSARDSGFRSVGDRGTGDRATGGRGPGARGAGNRSVLEEQLEEEQVDETNTEQEQPNKMSDRPPPTPKESRPVLRNFNGYKPPAEPAEPKPQPRKSPATADPDFDRAWELYAYKVQKAAALKAWAKAVKIVDAQTVLDAIPAYVASTKLPKEPEKRGVYNRAHFASWLNGERWNDEIEPPKKGYQGSAGSDRASREEYEDVAKSYPVPWLMKNSAYAGLRDGCYAWYWHWNRAEQADWTIEQLVGSGNTPEDAAVLHQAFRHGPPEHWIELLADINIKADA